MGNVTINNYAGQEVEKVKPITKETNFFKGNISNLENEIRCLIILEAEMILSLMKMVKN